MSANASTPRPRKLAAAAAAVGAVAAATLTSHGGNLRSPFVATPGSGACAACGEHPIDTSMLVCRACWWVLTKPTKDAVYDALNRFAAEPPEIDLPALRAVQVAAVREAQAGRSAPQRSGPPLPTRRGEWPSRQRPERRGFKGESD